MPIEDNIKYLSSLTGVSGNEKNAAKEIIKLFEKYCDEIKTDALGNIIALKKGNGKTDESVMLEAHMDEIGLMVTEIDENGFLYFTNIGGIDARILPANRVTVHGKKDLRGVIGAKPPHLMSEEEKDKSVPMDKLFIDIGLKRDEAINLVSVGDTVTFCGDAVFLSDDFIAAKSQDDRTSVAIIYDVFEKFSGKILPFDLYGVIAVQEEVGTRGSLCAAYSVDPTFAIAIDVCHATTPDAKDDTYESDSGTVITLGPNLHPSLTQNIINSMDKNDIKYNLDTEGGNTGTDAWSIQISRNGIPTALFSIPLRYMHTPCETLCVSDAKKTSDAISAFLTSLESAGEALC